MRPGRTDDEIPARSRITRRGFLQRFGAIAPAVAFSLAAARRSEERDLAEKRGSSARAELATPTPRSTWRPPPPDFTRPVPSAVAVNATQEIVIPAPNPALAYQNPIVAENCPDPHVLNDNGRFYMVSTSHVLPAFPIRESTDLVNWQHQGVSVFTRDNRPDWARDHFWAPELHRVGDLYVVYYTARASVTNRLCIGAAAARTPLGPYRDLGRPLVSAPVTVLDPTFLRDDDGRQYLYWKADAGPGNPSGPICVQELTRDGLHLIGDHWEIARNDLPWEERLVEGPSVMKRDGMYYLFYSGGKFSTASYAVGVARSTSPVAGFEKRGEPILRGSPRWQGPGHNSIVSHEGHDYIVYHAWEGERFRNVRPGLIDHIVWGDDGWPSVGDGIPREAWDPR